MRVKLQPPSGSELPPHNPILPPSAITQVMLIANPAKVSLLSSVTVNFPEKIATCSHDYGRKSYECESNVVICQNYLTMVRDFKRVQYNLQGFITSSVSPWLFELSYDYSFLTWSRQISQRALICKENKLTCSQPIVMKLSSLPYNKTINCIRFLTDVDGFYFVKVGRK